RGAAAGSPSRAGRTMAWRPARSRACSGSRATSSQPREIDDETTMRYAIVIEKAIGNFSAYVPDLPGCVATGATPAEAERLMREAIEVHRSGLVDDGAAIPEPSSRVDYVEVSEPEDPHA